MNNQINVEKVKLILENSNLTPEQIDLEIEELAKKLLEIPEQLEMAEQTVGIKLPTFLINSRENIIQKQKQSQKKRNSPSTLFSEIPTTYVLISIGDLSSIAYTCLLIAGNRKASLLRIP